MIEGMKLYGSATVGTKGQIVIPAEAREELKIKVGDKLVVVRDPHGGGVMMLKAETIEKILGQMQAKLGSLAESVKQIKKQ